MRQGTLAAVTGGRSSVGNCDWWNIIIWPELTHNLQHFLRFFFARTRPRRSGLNAGCVVEVLKSRSIQLGVTLAFCWVPNMFGEVPKREVEILTAYLLPKQYSGQIITTSAEVTPSGGLVRETQAQVVSPMVAKDSRFCRFLVLGERENKGPRHQKVVFSRMDIG